MQSLINTATGNVDLKSRPNNKLSNSYKSQKLTTYTSPQNAVLNLLEYLHQTVEVEHESYNKLVRFKFKLKSQSFSNTF